MKRLVANSVTDALMKVMEIADNIEHIVILYQPKESSDSDGFFTDGEQSVATSVWLIERYKAWLVHHECPCERDS